MFEFEFLPPSLKSPSPRHETAVRGMYGKREANSIFGSIPFNPDDQQRTDAYLRQKLNSNFLSRRPGPGGRRLTYLESCKAIEIANEAFGFNGWSCRIVDCNVECKEKSDDGRWSVIYSSVVRIELKDGASHEDVGFGQSDGMKDLGAALEQAKKASISDARKRALRLFGEYLGNSCYDKEHIKDVAANRANQSTLQSPTSIKIENGQANTPSGTNTPPLHPPRPALPAPAPNAPPNFQPPPRSAPAPAPVGIAVGSRVNGVDGPVNGSSYAAQGHSTTTHNLSNQPSSLAPVNLQQAHGARHVSPVVKAEPKALPGAAIHAAAARNLPPGTNAVHTWPAPTNPPPASYLPVGHQPHGHHAGLPSRAPTAPEGARPSPNAFHRPLPTNVVSSSPSMQHLHSADSAADMTRKRCLDMYGPNATNANHNSHAVDDLEGLRLSQFEFDDGPGSAAKKTRSS